MTTTANPGSARRSSASTASPSSWPSLRSRKARSNGVFCTCRNAPAPLSVATTSCPSLSSAMDIVRAMLRSSSINRILMASQPAIRSVRLLQASSAALQNATLGKGGRISNCLLVPHRSLIEQCRAAADGWIAGSERAGQPKGRSPSYPT